MTTITETNITQQLDLSQFQIVLPEETIQIVEYPSSADFPAVGKVARLYISLDSGLPFRWNGNAYTPAAIPDGKATEAEATAGEDNTTWMTPLRTKQAIAELAPPRQPCPRPPPPGQSNAPRSTPPAASFQPPPPPARGATAPPFPIPEN